MSRPAVMSTKWMYRVRTRGGSRSVPLRIVMHPPRGNLALRQRDEEDDGEEGVGLRRGVAHPEVLEALLVDGVDDGQGAVQRPSAGEEEGEREDLERPDHADHEEEVRGRGEQGERDVPEELPPRGAVHLGRLVVLGADVLQAGEED